MTGKSQKRIKRSSSITEVETKAEEKSAPPRQREPNRLQKAISGKSKEAVTEKKVTIAQARRIKKAEKQLGILSALPNAPVEIFCEIVFYFSPADLLRLSLVSRDLRDFLLSKNSRRLWTTCLSTTDLPPCPDDLNEPQYVFLVYDSSCNACDDPRVKSVYYDLRLRLCKSCFETNILSDHDLISKYYSLVSIAWELIPSFRQPKSWHRYYYEPDIVAVAKELEGIKDDSRRQEYFQKRRVLVEKISRSAQKLRDWEKSRTLRRKAELSDVAEQFTESVLEKLKEMGYTENDWSHWYYAPYEEGDLEQQWHKLVRQKKVLTQRMWKTLLPKLQDLLDSNRTLLDKEDRDTRASKRNSEFRSLYRNYCNHLDLSSGEVELMPCVSDLKENATIIESVNYDDGHRAFTEELFVSLLPTITKVHLDHKQRILADHEEAIDKHRAKGKARVDSEHAGDLQHVFLASSFFLSGYYSACVYYFLNPNFPVVAGTPNKDFHNRMSCGCYGWNENNDSVNVEEFYVTLADALLANLGFPPTTTMSTTFAMGKCFVCSLCDESFQEPLGWVELIKHYVEKSRWETDAQRHCSWNENKPITVLKTHPARKEDALVVSARKLEDKELMLAVELQKVNANSKFKRCAMCKALRVDYLMTEEQVTAHIRTIHGKVAELSDILDCSN